MPKFNHIRFNRGSSRNDGSSSVKELSTFARQHFKLM